MAAMLHTIDEARDADLAVVFDPDPRFVDWA
jgi:sugar/nucleoside kinase (ribokinase family)